MQAHTFTDYRGYRHVVIRSPAEILIAKGKSLKHEIGLLKRRLAYARNAETPHIFPSIAHQVLIEAQSPIFSTNEDGQVSSRGLTDWYVTAFCKNNHLKEC